MSGCVNCGAQQEAQDRELRLASVKDKAKAYATEKQKIVIVYQDPVEGFVFIEKEAADRLRIPAIDCFLPD